MVAGGLPTAPLGTPAGACSPGATGHPALVARRRHLNVDQKVYLDLLQTIVWPVMVARAVVTSWCYWLQRDGAMAPLP